MRGYLRTGTQSNPVVVDLYNNTLLIAWDGEGVADNQGVYGKIINYSLPNPECEFIIPSSGLVEESKFSSSSVAEKSNHFSSGSSSIAEKSNRFSSRRTIEEGNHFSSSSRTAKGNSIALGIIYGIVAASVAIIGTGSTALVAYGCYRHRRQVVARRHMATPIEGPSASEASAPPCELDSMPVATLPTIPALLYISQPDEPPPLYTPYPIEAGVASSAASTTVTGLPTVAPPAYSARP